MSSRRCTASSRCSSIGLPPQGLAQRVPLVLGEFDAPEDTINVSLVVDHQIAPARLVRHHAHEAACDRLKVETNPHSRQVSIRYLPHRGEVVERGDAVVVDPLGRPDGGARGDRADRARHRRHDHVVEHRDRFVARDAR